MYTNIAINNIQGLSQPAKACQKLTFIMVLVYCMLKYIAVAAFHVEQEVMVYGS